MNYWIHDALMTMAFQYHYYPSQHRYLPQPQHHYNQYYLHHRRRHLHHRHCYDFLSNHSLMMTSAVSNFYYQRKGGEKESPSAT
ncbi:hypothetical protein GQX74_013098 [Glossina fuscipes]|nr:hypothetical protein GQX74_013098 [Glossina fuscipes]